MRNEIDLPPTDLLKLNHPKDLPSPPGGTPPPEGSGDVVTNMESDTQYSWYYYLAEIAWRRMANRITLAMYSAAPRSWLAMPLQRMQRIATELDGQIMQWSDHIPELRSLEEDSPSEELRYLLRGRFLGLRECIWRPFLYVMIHTTPAASELPAIELYAQRCVELAIQHIDHLANKHRHHGTWYAARQLFTKGLVILAAVKSGKIKVPAGWENSMNLVISTLRYWEDEAPDLRMARQSLETLHASIPD